MKAAPCKLTTCPLQFYIQHIRLFPCYLSLQFAHTPLLHSSKPRKIDVVRESNPWMFDPTNSRRIGWDVFLLLPLLAYIAIVMPFVVRITLKQTTKLRSI